MPIRAVAFDIIDTVFQLEPLRPALEAHGLSGSDVETLYAAMLRDAMAVSLAGDFAPLSEIMAGALDQLRANRGLAADAAARDAVAEAMKTLPPFADAGAAFRELKAKGLAVHALSNGARASTEGLLARAGLRELFDGVHSVEAARVYKPHPDVYRTALDAIGLPAAQVMMVATHAWDLHGAKRCGMATGFVARGQDWPSAFASPDLTGAELADVAQGIVAG